ncbi:hypothetical protein ACFC3O_33960 [Streptomyces sp. NPDC056007]|uniref:hypothetical protein n=1 Tax=Streptomyces sp. NPDC056007 TaxID=3345678 RepID=UPI0035D783BB
MVGDNPAGDTDAPVRTFNYTYQASHLHREGGWTGRWLALGQVPQMWEVNAELIGALHGVRLCGREPVIAAAEAVVAAASDLDLATKNRARFQRLADRGRPPNVFLDACREDLYPARGLRRLGRWVRRRVLRRG